MSLLVAMALVLIKDLIVAMVARALEAAVALDLEVPAATVVRLSSSPKSTSREARASVLGAAALPDEETLYQRALLYEAITATKATASGPALAGTIHTRSTATSLCQGVLPSQVA